MTDEEQDIVTDEINQIDLLMQCPSINYYKEEGPDIPRFSDTYYKFMVDSPQEEMNLKAELKEEILSIIQNYDNKI